MNDVLFSLGGMWFEYNEEKNQGNIKKHGISFRSAARVFFDYDRIELYDEENSLDEDRFIRSEIHRPERFLSAVL